MTPRARWTVLLASGLMLVAGAAWAEREFRVLRGFESHADYTDLPDWEPAGFVVARLMYPAGGFGGFGGFGGSNRRDSSKTLFQPFPGHGRHGGRKSIYACRCGYG